MPLLDRTRTALPRRKRFLQRLNVALGGLFRPTPRGSRLPAGATDNAAPTPAALTIVETPPASARVRAAWRSTSYLEQLDRAIATPRLRRCVTIAVVSPKGGVGKTTTTALLGTLLSLVRRDRIVAVDTNPDYGTLGRVLAPEHQLFVDDLLARVEDPEDLTLTELDTQLGRAAHGLMVLPAPTDPERMERLDEQAYRRVIERLKGFVGVVLLDCGTGLQEPAAQAALNTCDQILLITDAEPATASLVAEAAKLLAGPARPAGVSGARAGGPAPDGARAGGPAPGRHRPITVVVNKMPADRTRLDLDRLGTFLPQAFAMVVLPSEPQAASRLSAGGFDWRDAPEPWKRSCRELAVVLTSAWADLGLTAP